MKEREAIVRRPSLCAVALAVVCPAGADETPKYGSILTFMIPEPIGAAALLRSRLEDRAEPLRQPGFGDDLAFGSPVRQMHGQADNPGVTLGHRGSRSISGELAEINESRR